MKTLSKDARGFVEGVVGYLRHEGKMTSSLPKVETLFRKVTSGVQKENKADVASAVVLTELEKQSLSRTLARLVNHAVSLSFKVDKQLGAGLRVQIGDWIIDTTFQTQLEQMSQLLK